MYLDVFGVLSSCVGFEVVVIYFLFEGEGL